MIQLPSQIVPNKPKFYINKPHLVFILVAEGMGDWVQSANGVHSPNDLHLCSFWSVIH